MKFLALSDIHGDAYLSQRMAQKAKEESVDLVILAGDLADEQGFISNIVGPFTKQGLEVVVLPGNHEGMAEINFLEKQYGAINLHGKSIVRDGIGFFGVGYGNIGLCQISEKDSFNLLQEAHNQLPEVRTKVMVTHTHPKTATFGLGMFPACQGIKQALHKFSPDLHICGHVHETEGMEEMINKTRVVNVGRKGFIFKL